MRHAEVAVPVARDGGENDGDGLISDRQASDPI
jgi:hypothetical protein